MCLIGQTDLRSATFVSIAVTRNGWLLWKGTVDMRLDLSVDYLGLKLVSPVIVGSCPLTLDREAVRQFQLAGAGAVVLPSLFEEQVVHHLMQSGASVDKPEATAEQLGYRDCDDRYNGGPAAYLQAIADLKRTTGIPVIANLDGYTSGHWLSFAQQMQASGADALELSLHTDTSDPSRGAEAVERTLEECVRKVRAEVSIPVSVKLAPLFTSLGNLAWQLAEAGAAGMVLFRLQPRWEVNVDSLHATTRWSLSPAGHIDATIAGLIQARSGGPHISLAASGGISSAADMVKTALAGADAAMVTSEIYREGPEAVSRLTHELSVWLQEHRYASFGDLIRRRPQPRAITRQRLNYLQPLTEADAYEDPTPGVPPRSGDRWGHLQDD